MTPNKERIAWWVHDLETTPNLQGTGRLYNPRTGAFCCLGRACEVYRAATGDGEFVEHPDSSERAPYAEFVTNRMRGLGGEIYELPIDVFQWFGFTNNDPVLADGHNCVHANDVREWDFATIAQALRVRYL